MEIRVEYHPKIGGWFFILIIKKSLLFDDFVMKIMSLFKNSKWVFRFIWDVSCLSSYPRKKGLKWPKAASSKSMNLVTFS